MEYSENQDLWSEIKEREQILMTERIVELFRQDNDFEEHASLNFLSKQLGWLPKEQFNLCNQFIYREYEKINIAKKERPWLSPNEFYLREFINHDILSKFQGEKLTMILQFMLKHERIDLCIQKYHYDDEKKLSQTLQKINEIQLWSLIRLNQESFNEFIILAKLHPKIIEFIINNIEIIDNEHIEYISRINKLFSCNRDNKENTVFMNIFWLLFFNQQIDIEKDITEIFRSIHPSFQYTGYSLDSNDWSEYDSWPEYVDESYYKMQLKEMQKDYLDNKISKEEFIIFLKADYIKRRVFKWYDEVRVPW